MKNSWILLLFIIFNGFSNAQSIKEARFLFDNFEYELAATAFEKNNLQNGLSTSDLEKLIVCYSYTYNATKGLPLAEELIKTNAENPTYWLWKANFEKVSKKFDDAIISAKTYLKLGGTELPLFFIESCELWKENSQLIEGDLIDLELNDSRANFKIITGGHIIYFKEIELDSTLQTISNPSPYSDILLLRPFIDNNGTLNEWKMIDEEKYPLYSINSIQIDQDRKQVYFSASKPIDTQNGENKPNIFTGEFSSFHEPLQNVRPWIYSGKEDSTSCAHVALSKDGTQLVFSKMGNQTKGSDFYISHLTNEEWSKPEPLNDINTIGNEMFPVFSGDSAFFFSTDGRIGYGDLDIFKCAIANGTLTKNNIVQLNLPINSEADDFLYTPIGETTSSFVSNRRGGKGDDDIWHFTPIVHEVVTDTLITEPTTFDINAFLSSVNQHRLFFDFDKATTKDTFPFLDQLNNLITEGANLKIEILGYTDSRGSRTYNKELGLKRAKYALKQFIAAGFDPKTLTVRSFGKDSPENICGVQKCSEEEHAKNRFVRLNVILIK